MAIEEKTNQLVRDELRDLGYYEEGGGLCVEEKQSANDTIRKLLAGASKQDGGTGGGYPEFIISKKNSDVALVVECKARVSHHESEYRDQPAKYAVDGALHYARFLKAKYNVVAVAVSGQSKGSLKVSTFIWRKGVSNYYQKGWGSITSYEDYHGEFHSQSSMLSLADLRKHARRLHNDIRLHAKLKEAQKPLFIGGLLLALDNRDFANTYASIARPKKLAQEIISAIRDNLEESGMDEEKRRSISGEFNFIESSAHLVRGSIDANNPSYDNNVLHKILCDLHQNVYPTMKSSSVSNVDFMGEFYQEFIRYTGGDGKGLGIILTPRHITELFVELADVHINTKVLDLCAGTGGFLVAAMSRMLQGDRTVGEIEQVKKGNLFGVESQSDIFALAAVNMFVRGDGKANLIKEDSLAADPGAELRKLHGKCQVGLMNPPYSQKTQKELEFVERLLDMLAVNGRAVVIVPLKCTNGDNDVRERILKKHTLKSVMIMPQDLFVGASTHTCIMTFTAGQPHEDSLTWFSLWNDDGFSKYKKSRVDRYDSWTSIKQGWLESHKLQRETSTSVRKQVGYNDEWSALAYLPTDYSDMTVKRFKDTIRQHRLCQMRREGLVTDETPTGYMESALAADEKAKKLFAMDAKRDGRQIPTRAWGSFLLSDLFDVRGSQTTSLDDLLEMEKSSPGGRKYPYVTTRATNNGVDNYFPYYTEEVGEGVLTIDSATVGFTSYQKENFSASDHVEVLRPKFGMNKYVACFIQTILNLEQFRYGYGRKFNQGRIKSTRLFLPEKEKSPDYGEMERIVSQIDAMDWL